MVGWIVGAGVLHTPHMLSWSVGAWGAWCLLLCQRLGARKHGACAAERKLMTVLDIAQHTEKPPPWLAEQVKVPESMVDEGA